MENTLEKYGYMIDLCFNVKKTVGVVFDPNENSKIISNHFSCFMLSGQQLQYRVAQ